MKQLFFNIFLFLLFSCSGKNHVEHAHSDSIAMEKPKHAHHPHSHKGTANEHMHQSSSEELIKRFESRERDDYQQPEKVLAYLGDLKGKTIIDIGTGSGYFSVKLAQKAEKVIAADVNQEFLDHVQTRIDKDGLKNVELRKIPYDSPLLKDSEVDMIFIVNTYHHIENRSDYFAKAKKGLKENGELLIIDFFKTQSPVGPPVEMKVAIDEVIADLKKAGYTTFKAEISLLPYQYILRAQ